MSAALACVESPRSDQEPALLFAELATLDADDPRRAQLREQLVAEYMPMAGRLARRFANRGEHLEDLRQVALLGLVHAIDRFDPEQGVNFLAFAVPTIQGELRRHFRDRGWAMHVPRRLKDRYLVLNAAVGELSQELGRAPKPTEIAARVDMPLDEVLEGLQAAQAYRCDSLDEPLTDTEDTGHTIADTVGAADPDLELAENCQALRPLLARLPERERRVLMLRFFGGLTQTQIAAEVGLSQMHVSRLLAKTLRTLRDQLNRG